MPRHVLQTAKAVSWRISGININIKFITDDNILAECDVSLCKSDAMELGCSKIGWWN